MNVRASRRWVVLFGVMLLAIIGITLSADLQLIPARLLQIPLIDKFGHFGLYGTLALLPHLALKRRAIAVGRFSLPLAVVCVGILGMLDEFQQVFVGTRSVDLTDFAADLAGAIVFTLAADVIYAHVSDRAKIDA